MDFHPKGKVNFFCSEVKLFKIVFPEFVQPSIFFLPSERLGINPKFKHVVIRMEVGVSKMLSLVDLDGSLLI